eukprot:scaffold3183_cov381-Prasinococcus_capsulatus_cf.AAC.26
MPYELVAVTPTMFLSPCSPRITIAQAQWVSNRMQHGATLSGPACLATHILAIPSRPHVGVVAERRVEAVRVKPFRNAPRH